MAMRSVANLNISLGLFGFPVKVYKATNDPSEGIAFRQIHNTCGKPINQVKRCNHCNSDVQQADLLKGYEVAPGQFINFTEQEIKDLRPEAAGTIKIDGYLDESEIDSAFHDGTVYYISPDRGDKKKKLDCDTFVTWRDALKGRWAIGKVVMYGREHVVALRAVEKVLAMHFIRTTSEIRNVADVPGYDDLPEEAKREHLDLMSQLVEKQSISLDSVVLEEDAYVRSVKELIEARTAGLPNPAQPAFVAAPAAVDLMAMLKASLAAGK